MMSNKIAEGCYTIEHILDKHLPLALLRKIDKYLFDTYGEEEIDRNVANDYDLAYDLLIYFDNYPQCINEINTIFGTDFLEIDED